VFSYQLSIDGSIHNLLKELVFFCLKEKNGSNPSLLKNSGFNQNRFRLVGCSHSLIFVLTFFTRVEKETFFVFFVLEHFCVKSCMRYNIASLVTSFGISINDCSIIGFIKLSP